MNIKHIMRREITQLLEHAVNMLKHHHVIPAAASHVSVDVARSKQAQHGHFSTNLAFKLAAMSALRPVVMASRLVGALPHAPWLVHVEVAGEGFINFFTCSQVSMQVIPYVLQEKLPRGRAFNPEADRRGHDVRALARIEELYQRTDSVLRQMQVHGVRQTQDEAIGLSCLEMLTLPYEICLIEAMDRYLECILAEDHAYDLPGLIDHLFDLAENMHGYYNVVSLFDEQASLRCARLCLLMALHQVLYNGIQRLRISIPEMMNG